MPDPDKVLRILERAADFSRRTPGRTGGVVHPRDADEILVAGDLHGNLAAFRALLLQADLRNHPRRHLVVQELVHGDFFYPDDGGDRSHQLIDIACALKCDYPSRVHILLGNHELSELTGRSIAKSGVPLNALFRLGVQTAYGPRADEFIAAYHRLFRSLPLAVRTENRVFLCHTLPNAPHLDTFDPAALLADDWTDAQMKRGGEVYAITWGRDNSPETADRFASLVDADLFVTGHQPCDLGFQRANHRQLIIDGTPPLPCCCLFPSRGPITLDDLASGVRPLG